MTQTPLIDLRIDEIDFPVRVVNGFHNAGIETVGDLVGRTESELLRIPNFGRLSLNAVKEFLVARGLRLGIDMPKRWMVERMARPARQKLIYDWCARVFGEPHAASVAQRGIRLAEEAIEAAQAAGCEREMLHQLVDHIFEKPAGDLFQELGGVSVCALVMAESVGISLDSCEVCEIDRVTSKPDDHFRQRNAVKNAAGFDIVNAKEPD